MKATVVQFETQGPPDVMRHVEVEIPDPGPSQVMIEQTVLGLNFIDVYVRSGLYPLELPSGVGAEAAMGQSWGSFRRARNTPGVPSR